MILRFFACFDLPVVEVWRSVSCSHVPIAAIFVFFFFWFSWSVGWLGVLVSVCLVACFVAFGCLLLLCVCSFGSVVISKLYDCYFFVLFLCLCCDWEVFSVVCRRRLVGRGRCV